MMSLFTIAPKDASVDYLSQIFGSMNGIIAITGQPAGPSISLLGTMFKTFNTVVLAVGALLLVYVTVVGIMNTAHEGQFMGKNWNNLWIPIRTVMGIALLVPTASGYSSLQIVMMWVIMQGIGAADTLWSTVLVYVNTMGSVYTQSQVKLPDSGSNEAMGGLFKGVACEVTAKQAYPNPSTGSSISGAGSYYCANSKDPFCTKPLTTVDPSGTSVSFGPEGSCGTLKYCNLVEDCKGNSDSMACLACQGQISALTAIIETYQNIAKGFVQSDYSYRQFFSSSGAKADKPNPNWQWIYDYCSAQKIPQSACVGGATLPSPVDNGDSAGASPAAVKTVYWLYAPSLSPALGNTNFSDTATKYYMGLLETSYTTYLVTHAQAKGALDKNQVFQRARETGWIFAGGYYYAVSSKRNSDLNYVIPPLEWNGPTDLNQGKLKDIRNNFASAGYLILASKGDTKPGGSNQASEQLSSPFGSATSSLTGTIDKMTRSENPLLGMQIAGKVMLIIAQGLFIVMWHVISEVGIMGYFSAEILGNGFMNPVGPVMTTLTIFILPAIYGLLGLLITIGATLSIYIPLIPYVVFTFGAIGWLISVVEAMVAGPLVALGIISPSGNHEILGKAEPALMLLFNVFLRPSLMIFGLMASMLLASVVLQMINAAFWTIVFNGIFDIANTGGKDNTFYANGASAGAGASALDLLSLMLFTCAYVTTVFTAMNKCFSAIYIIPQQVMSWIGGQGSQYGEAEALGEVKGGVSGGAGKAGGGMVGTGKTAATGVKDLSEQAGKKSAQEKQGGPTITGGD